jgi:hypothetical protein
VVEVEVVDVVLVEVVVDQGPVVVVARVVVVVARVVVGVATVVVVVARRGAGSSVVEGARSVQSSPVVVVV